MTTLAPDPVETLRDAERAYQRAARAFKAADEQRAQAIARAAQTMSTRQIARHVALSQQRVGQIAKERAGASIVTRTRRTET